MNKQEHIENEVKQTLEVFDRIKPVAGNPFLHTRLKARLEDSASQTSGIPVWQIAVTISILVVNGLFLQQYWFSNQPAGELADELVTEWGLKQDNTAYFLSSSEK